MDTIRMAFVLAAMDNLDVCAADISPQHFYMVKLEKRYISLLEKNLETLLENG